MSGNKEQIDVSLIGNDKIEEAIVNIQKEPTEENLVRALSIVRHRMNDKGQLIIAVEPLNFVTVLQLIHYMRMIL